MFVKERLLVFWDQADQGKSTLLRCINLLERPDNGKIIYKGENIDIRKM